MCSSNHNQNATTTRSRREGARIPPPAKAGGPLRAILMGIGAYLAAPEADICRLPDKGVWGGPVVRPVGRAQRLPSSDTVWLVGYQVTR